MQPHDQSYSKSKNVRKTGIDILVNVHRMVHKGLK